MPNQHNFKEETWKISSTSRQITRLMTEKTSRTGFQMKYGLRFQHIEIIQAELKTGETSRSGFQKRNGTRLKYTDSKLYREKTGETNHTDRRREKGQGSRFNKLLNDHRNGSYQI